MPGLRVFLWPGALIAVLAALAPAHAVASQDGASTEPPPGAVTLSVVPPPRQPRFGEPVRITIVLANASAQDVWYLHAAPQVDFTYILADELGQHVPSSPRLNMLSNPNAYIPANGEQRIPVQLDAFMDIDHPGTYTLNVSTTLYRRPPATPIPLTAKPVTIVVRDEAGAPPQGLKLSIVPATMTVRLGDPIVFALVVDNTSDDTVAFESGDSVEDDTYEAVDDAGQRVAVQALPLPPISARGRSRLNAHSRTWSPINVTLLRDRPGTYTLRVATKLRRRYPAPCVELSAPPVTIVVTP
jgi:hypothetical protein